MEPTRKIRNVGIADLYIPFGPHDGLNVPQGEVADVPEVIAVSLLDQPNNWVMADEPEAEPAKARSGAKAAVKKDED